MPAMGGQPAGGASPASQGRPAKEVHTTGPGCSWCARPRRRSRCWCPPGRAPCPATGGRPGAGRQVLPSGEVQVARWPSASQVPPPRAISTGTVSEGVPAPGVGAPLAPGHRTGARREPGRPCTGAGPGADVGAALDTVARVQARLPSAEQEQRNGGRLRAPYRWRRRSRLPRLSRSAMPAGARSRRSGGQRGVGRHGSRTRATRVSCGLAGLPPERAMLMLARVPARGPAR